MVIIANGVNQKVFADSNWPIELQERLKKDIVLYMDNPTAYVNLNKTQVDTENANVCPIIKDGRTLVPVRFISEAIGANVDWDESTSTVSIDLNGNTVKLTIGSKKISVNNTESQLDVPAQIVNERTFIPLRALVEALGKKIFWDDRGLIVISDNENIIDTNIEQELVDKLINNFQPELFPIYREEKYGYVNLQGEMIIQPQFSDAKNFHEGLACIGIKNKEKIKYGFINKYGKIVIQPLFDSAEDFSNGIAVVKMGERYSFIDKKGNYFTNTKYEYAEGFHYGLAVVKINGMYRYINLDGNIAIKSEFISAESFHEGLAKVEVDGKYGFINISGEIVIKPVYWAEADFSEGSALVLYLANENDMCWGYIDRKGKFLLYSKTNPLSNAGGYFSDGLARLSKAPDNTNTTSDEWKCGYINQDGEIAINLIYEKASDFSEGLALVKFNGKYGFIDKTGEFVIEPIFNDANSFYRGLAYVEMGDSWGYIDKTGALIGFNEIHSKNEKNISNLGLKIIQDGKVYDISNQEENIELKKSGFSIRFNLNKCDEKNNKNYAVQIAALDNEVFFNIIHDKLSANDIPYFMLYTSMAASGPYEDMCIDNCAHHYIYYDENNEIYQRAKLIKQINNDLIEGEWNINRIFYDGIAYSISDTPLNNIYLVVYNDNDLDGIIDSNEYAKIKITFKNSLNKLV